MSWNTENDRIPPQALVVIVVMFVVELNFLRAPRNVSRAAGNDGWIALLIASVVIAVALLLIYRVMHRFPDKTLVEIAQTVLGVPLGIIVIAVYFFFWLARAGTLLLIHSYLFASQLLPSTPEIWLTLYMLLLSAYLVRHGLEPMARLYLILLGAAFLPVLPIVALALRNVEWGYLGPVLADGWLPVFRGVWVAYGASVGPAIIMMMGPFLAHWRGAWPTVLVSVLFICVPAVTLHIILQAHFGAQGIAEHEWPTLALLEVIEVPGFSGLRLDPIFLTVWSLLVFGTISLAHYGAAAILCRLFRLKSNVWPVWTTTALIGVIAVLPINPQDVLALIDAVRPFTVPLITLLIPALLLAVARIRGLGSG